MYKHNDMETINNNSVNEVSNTQLTEKKRSASYPASPILEAYQFALKINTQFSTVAEVSREEIAIAFNLKSGSIIRDISSCVQYGLLNKNTAEGKYKLSEIFSEIFRPENDRDKKLAFIRAFGTPKIYKELIAKYDNSVIPLELNNTLIKNHEIREEVAQNVADIFIQSGRDVGVINEGRVLKYSATMGSLQKTQYAIIEEVSNGENNESDSEQTFNVPTLKEKKDGKKNINIPIHLIGDKVAGFSYPADMTENDVKIVEHQLAGILLRIKLGEEEKNKGVGENP